MKTWTKKEEKIIFEEDVNKVPLKHIIKCYMQKGMDWKQITIGW